MVAKGRVEFQLAVRLAQSGMEMVEWRHWEGRGCQKEKSMSCPSTRVCLGLLVVAVLMPGARAAESLRHPDELVGQPADIAASAYQYRADRKADENPPESWLAIMRYAGQPLNKPVDTSAPAVKQVLCALLWEEIRPVQRVELTWGPDAPRRPAPGISR